MNGRGDESLPVVGHCRLNGFVGKMLAAGSKPELVIAIHPHQPDARGCNVQGIENVEGPREALLRTPDFDAAVGIHAKESCKAAEIDALRGRENSPNIAECPIFFGDALRKRGELHRPGAIRLERPEVAYAADIDISKVVDADRANDRSPGKGNLSPGRGAVKFEQTVSVRDIHNTAAVLRNTPVLRRGAVLFCRIALQDIIAGFRIETGVKKRRYG